MNVSGMFLFVLQLKQVRSLVKVHTIIDNAPKVFKDLEIALKTSVSIPLGYFECLS